MKRSPSPTALRAEIAARDTFLTRATGGLAKRVAALREALAEARLSPEAREALTGLVGFARELCQIAEVDVEEPAPETIDLGATLKQLLTAQRAAVKKTGRVVELSVAGPAPIACAPADVEMIMAELVGNALKYGAGPVLVRVDTTRTRVRLTIRDGGPGVPRALRRAVLQRFVRGRGAKPGTGYGVGLWLVRKVARGYGGGLTLSDGAVSVHWPLAPSISPASVGRGGREPRRRGGSRAAASSRG